jgi:hypothetical protein
MGDAFALAKDFRDLRLDEIERLLEQLYLRRADRIDCLDLVDRGCVHVVGGYLFDQIKAASLSARALLEPLGAPDRHRQHALLRPARRREDTYGIAALLRREPHDLVQKATGGVLREAGKRDAARLVLFLEEHAAAMPRVMLRYAVERLEPEQRAHFRQR